MVDVRRLRVLCEVARQGSFSAAATVLGYTQPAVSRQVAMLEGELGMQLVRRLPQGVVLTDAGQVLVSRGEAVLGQLEDIEAQLRALSGLEGGRLRFAAFASACASWVPMAIARFRERYPAVELVVTMADPHVALPRLHGGELDLIVSHDPMPELREVAKGVSLTYEGAPPAAGAGGAGSLDVVPLFDDPMYVALPVGHRLAEVEPLSMQRLADEPWMLATPKTCPDSRLLLRACHHAGFEPRIAFENDDYSAILGFVAAGVGIALVPDMVLRAAREDVVIRALSPAPPARPIAAVMPAGYRSAAMEAMLSVLAEVSEEWLAGRLHPAAHDASRQSAA